MITISKFSLIFFLTSEESSDNSLFWENIYQVHWLLEFHFGFILSKMKSHTYLKGNIEYDTHFILYPFNPSHSLTTENPQISRMMFGKY